MEPFTEFEIRKEQLATLKKIGYELERGFEDLIGILRDIRQELSFINTHEIAEAIAPDSEPAIPVPPLEEVPEPKEQAEPEKAENPPPYPKEPYKPKWRRKSEKNATWHRVTSVAYYYHISFKELCGILSSHGIRVKNIWFNGPDGKHYNAATIRNKDLPAIHKLMLERHERELLSPLPDSEQNPPIAIPPSEEAPEPQGQAEPEKVENTQPHRATTGKLLTPYQKSYYSMHYGAHPDYISLIGLAKHFCVSYSRIRNILMEKDIKIIVHLSGKPNDWMGYICQQDAERANEAIIEALSKRR